MSVFRCPYCNACVDGEVFSCGVDGFYGEEDSQSKGIKCPKCGRPINVDIEVRATFEISAANTVNVEGKEVPDMSVDMADVMHHFVKSPGRLRVAPDELTCEVCRRSGDSACRTAADYIKAGWRVVAEYPGVRATCPACCGGDHEHTA